MAKKKRKAFRNAKSKGKYTIVRGAADPRIVLPTRRAIFVRPRKAGDP